MGETALLLYLELTGLRHLYTPPHFTCHYVLQESEGYSIFISLGSWGVDGSKRHDSYLPPVSST